MGEPTIARLLRALVVLPALLLLVPATAQASVPDESVEPVTSTSVPVDTTTAPTPPTTEPVDTGLVGVDETGSTDASAITWLGIVAAVALIGIAVWWMLRHDDEEFVPPPDDDWPRDSEVI